MTFVFTEDQRNELLVVIEDVLRAYNNAPAQEGVMTAGYRAVFDAITSVVPINESQDQFLLVPETGVPENVWT